MSVDTHFHVGPYIKIKSTKVSSDYTMDSCGNKKCKNFKRELDGNYCDECGGKILELHLKDEEYLDYFEFMEERKLDENTFIYVHDNNHLNKENEILLIENFYRKKNDPQKLNPESRIEEICETTSIEELDWFQEKYKKFIDLFKKTFGSDNVHVGFGAFVYYS